MIKVITIGSDRNLFKKDSPVRERIVHQGRVFDELHIIVFALSSLGLKPEKIADNVWLYPTSSFLKLFYMRNATRIAQKIISERKMSSADTVVSAQDPFELGLAAKNIAARSGLTLHIQIHTDFLSPFFRRSSVLNRIRVAIARTVLPKARGIRVVSARIKDSLKEGGIELQTEPEVLPVFTDISRFSQAEIAFDLHQKFPDFRFIILMVNRLSVEKNIPTGLRVFAKVVKKYPRTGLVIVGDGGEKKKLIALSRALGLEKNVAFIGGWPEHIESYYKTANMFLLLSQFEGYGLVLLEAAAAGCPIVTTDVGIAREILNGNYERFVCLVGDEKCLTDNIMKLLEDSKTRRQYSVDLALWADSQDFPDEAAYLKKYGAMVERCLESAPAKVEMQ